MTSEFQSVGGGFAFDEWSTRRYRGRVDKTPSERSPALRGGAFVVEAFDGGRAYSLASGDTVAVTLVDFQLPSLLDEWRADQEPGQ